MKMETTTNWSDLVRHASHGDHMVHLYQDPAFLVEAVGEYVASGLHGGEAAVIIATRENRRLFERQGLVPGAGLRMLDAEETAARFKEVLDQPLAQMLLSISASHRPATQMPLGQATLMWLAQNMPRTAQRVLEEVRARYSPA